MQKQRKQIKKPHSTSRKQECMYSKFQESKASVNTVLAPEHKFIKNKYSPLLLLISLYCWADTILYGVSLWSVWFNCPNCHLSRSFPLPDYWQGGSGVEVGILESIDAAGALLSSSQNTAGLPLLELPMQRRALWELLQGKIPASQADQYTGPKVCSSFGWLALYFCME